MKSNLRIRRRVGILPDKHDYNEETRKWPNSEKWVESSGESADDYYESYRVSFLGSGNKYMADTYFDIYCNRILM